METLRRVNALQNVVTEVLYAVLRIFKPAYGRETKFYNT
jgi:hypothetical protein